MSYSWPPKDDEPEDYPGRTTSPGPTAKKPLSQPAKIAWFFAISIVALALVALLLGRGFTLENGRLTVLGVDQDAAIEQAAGQQAQLQTLSNQVIANLGSQAGASTAAAIDISGPWSGPGGLNYQFTQVGSAVAFTEFSANGQILSVSLGTIDASGVLNFEATNGVSNQNESFAISSALLTASGSDLELTR